MVVIYLLPALSLSGDGGGGVHAMSRNNIVDNSIRSRGRAFVREFDTAIFYPRSFVGVGE